jgi:NADPH:quinone reductase-like Zn-dependent oxidoreductase
MKTMKALRFETYGPPSVLSLEDVPIPVPKVGEVLVEVHASAINPSDVKNVAGAFKTELPRTPGRDYAGVVVSGDAWRGKAVWGSGAGSGTSRDGAHAQYLVIASDGLSEKPSHLSMAEAGAVGVPYITAWSALIRTGELRPGETVLITGASGAVGRAATQLAHWKGAKVIGVDITDKTSEADVFIDARDREHPAVNAQVKALTNGSGVDLVLDAVGGSIFDVGLKSLRRGGRQVAITSVGNRRVDFDLVDFYHNELRLVGVDTLSLTASEIAKTMSELRIGFETGHLRPPSVASWPLEQAALAYQAVANGESSAKQVLLPKGLSAND